MEASENQLLRIMWGGVCMYILKNQKINSYAIVTEI